MIGRLGVAIFKFNGRGPIIGGQVVGASDKKAAGPKHDLIKSEDVAATFYRTLGIEHRKEYITTIGRAISIVRDGEIATQLISKTRS